MIKHFIMTYVEGYILKAEVYLLPYVYFAYMFYIR